MVGFYWISDIAIFRCICDIPHRSFCNNCNIVISFPRTCKYDCKQILLAINNWCDYCRRFGNIINQSVLIAYTRTIIPIPRLGDFFVGNKVFSWGFFVISNLLLSCLHRQEYRPSFLFILRCASHYLFTWVLGSSPRMTR